MGDYIHKSHNVSILLYHLVFPAKYRKSIFDPFVDQVLKEVCLEISNRYDIRFLEIGTDSNHVHFLIQSVPMFSITTLVKRIKSITAREIFRRCPEVKKELWGGQLWSDGYFASTVGKHSNADVITKYIQQQGITKEYIQLHEEQLDLFL